MSALVTPLDWDSDFFGFAIGRIELDGLDSESLAAADQQARDLGVKCLYGFLDPVDLNLSYLAQQAGYRLVEVAMDLDHRTSIVADPPPTLSVARQGDSSDIATTDDHLQVIAPWSRYAVDPRFGVEAALRMHRAWVQRAARGEEGRMLIVAEDASGVTGISTQTSFEAEEPRIDFIASVQPRSGAAQALVQFAFALFGSRLSWGGPIAARNIASLRFCENMGYRIARSQYVFHRWLDEEPGPSR